MDRLKSWIKVKTTPDVGYQTALKLFDKYGDPQDWNTSVLQDALAQRFITEEAFGHLSSDKAPFGWERLCKYCEQLQIHYTTVLDADYPTALRNIYAPPLILYYRGNLSNALSDWNLGVVGTRKPSLYGKAMTEAIVEPVASAGVTIISGMAFGIDTSAHQAALKARGKTIAVFAYGLDQIYPPQNRELAEKILDTGAHVSEYEPGSKMEKWNFPARNRIISGLSQGVFVIEGPITSGALLTAKFALEQSRDLYALPGQINVPNAEGPNHLIKNGARLVTNAEDILADFGITNTVSEQMDLFPELFANEKIVYDLLKEQQRAMGFDEFILATGFSIGQLSIVLLNLELKGLLVKSHGNTFALKG